MDAAANALRSVPFGTGAVVAFLVMGLVSFAALRAYARSASAPAVAPAGGEAEEAEKRRAAERAVTRAELAGANGSDGGPLYVAIKDPYSERVTVFDVAAGASFYGPGNAYHIFAARDATHGLAKSCLDPEQVTGDVSQLSAMERDTHMQWYTKFNSKYPHVGWLVDGDASADGDKSETTVETAETAAETEGENKKDV